MPNPIGGHQPYQANYASAYPPQPSYGAFPSYGASANPYGMPPAMGQQTQMLSIYMSLMQTQSSLQQGFSQFLGQGFGMPQPGYGAPAPSYGAPTQGYGAPAPSYGAPAPSYGGGGYQPAPAYKPAPTPVYKPAPAPAPPSKKGGYA